MSGCPVQGASGGGCPVKTSGASIESSWGSAFLGRLGWSAAPQPEGEPASAAPSPDSYNPAANDAHFDPRSKFPGQLRDLSKTRVVSSIPKSDFTPKHQPDGVGKWVYPSEQQYFNAMKHKGYNPPEEDMTVILAIHNTVNELGWTRILEWEALRGSKGPTLKRFMGRPKDLSPKARILVALGKDPPFDRHDWFVEREDGKEVRYVIDFYAKPPAGPGGGGVKSPSPLAGQGHGATVPVHLDVRPALDSPGALWDRIQWTFGARGR